MNDYRDIKDIAKKVRKQLKAEFPDHKFSVTIDRFSGGQAMNVALMAAPQTPFRGVDADTTYAQLNEYNIAQDYHDGLWSSNGRELTEAGAKMLIRVVEIANRENWNNSDIMIDYFDVNYYFGIAVGKWDRPFQVTQ